MKHNFILLVFLLLLFTSNVAFAEEPKIKLVKIIDLSQEEVEKNADLMTMDKFIANDKNRA